MNDTELIQRLRDLERPALPDPLYADKLFAILHREVGRSWPLAARHYQRLLAVAAGGAVLAVVAVFVIGVLGGAPIGPAGPQASAWPTPSASPSPTLGRGPLGWEMGVAMPFSDDWLSTPLAGQHGGRIWMLARDRTSTDPADWHLIGYDVSTDAWMDRGPIVGLDYPWSVGIDERGDILRFGHTGTDRRAWRVDGETLVTGVGPASFDERFQRSPLRGPDGRFYLLESARAPLSSPVSLVIYDPALDEWTEAPPMPTSRIRPIMAIDAAGRIYVIGGSPSKVERFDPTTGEWSTEADLPAAAQVRGKRSGETATFGNNGALYVISYDPSPVNETVAYRLDPTTRTWDLDEAPPDVVSPDDAVLTEDGSIVVLGWTGWERTDERVTWIWSAGE
jgi:hypothetical protein